MVPHLALGRAALVPSSKYPKLLHLAPTGSCFLVFSLNPKIIDWFWFGGGLKNHLVPTLCCEQGHLPLRLLVAPSNVALNIDFLLIL